MKTTRPYTQRARAEATARTRDRIVGATVELCVGRLSLDIALADVAERAEVSVQTVLRHFGTREGLLEVAWERATEDVREERRVPVGDVRAAVAAIVAHYERRGDWVLLTLANEHTDATSARFVATGRPLHRAWVAETFAPQVAASDDPVATTDLLVVATDVYTWKLLRHDAELDPGTTTERMLRLVEAVLPGSPEGNRP